MSRGRIKAGTSQSVEILLSLGAARALLMEDTYGQGYSKETVGIQNTPSETHASTSS